MVIGIAGGTGCGKTTFVNQVIDSLKSEKVAVIPQDAYYRDNSHIELSLRKKINFDHPDALEFSLFVSQVEALLGGKAIHRPVYCYQSSSRLVDTVRVEPAEVIILEGILILTHQPLRELMDLKLFIHAEPDHRLIRIMKRDLAERDRDVEEVLARYVETVQPMHEAFVEPSRRFADLIIPQGGRNPVALDMVRAYIQRHLHLNGQ